MTTPQCPVPLVGHGLRRRFGDDRAVDGVDLEVRAGQVHALVGLNGAGKTTLLRLLLGMVRPDAGRALLFGGDVERASTTAWQRVGHVIEWPFAYPELTVRRNLAAAALLHGVDPAQVEEVVVSAVEAFGLGRWADRRARHLSLGNRQRLGLASALVRAPDVLVLDEPANALDPAGVLFVRELLVAARDRGAAVLVSSHHLDQVARVADRITVLHRGRVVQELPPTGSDLEEQFFSIVHAADAGVAS